MNHQCNISNYLAKYHQTYLYADVLVVNKSPHCKKYKPSMYDTNYIFG